MFDIYFKLLYTKVYLSIDLFIGKEKIYIVALLVNLIY